MSENICEHVRDVEKNIVYVCNLAHFVFFLCTDRLNATVKSNFWYFSGGFFFNYYSFIYFFYILHIPEDCQFEITGIVFQCSVS